MPTTASLLAVATGTGILTLLQVKNSKVCRILEWGISFNGAAVAAGIEVELLDTALIFATVTASVDADIMQVDGGTPILASTSGLTYTTTGTGYTASGEGTIVATTVHDAKFLTPTGNYHFDVRPRPINCIPGNSYRIRVKAAAGVSAICYMTLEF